MHDVGPGKPYATLSEAISRAAAGDTVRLHADIQESLAINGTYSEEKPLRIVGVPIDDDGVLRRPRVTATIPRGVGDFCVRCRADNVIIQGLEFVGNPGPQRKQSAGLQHDSDNLTLRNCVFRNFSWKAICGTLSAGSIRIEQCEFSSSGVRDKWHTVDIFSRTAGATAVIQHCYFHDATGGHFIKSHCPRNTIRYNWFERPFYSCIQIVDVLSSDDEQSSGKYSHLYPLHSDIVGNVFYQGSSPGSKYSILQLGGEDITAPGTEGDFHIAHNLLLTSRGGEVPAVPLLVHGNVDRVRVFNNIFLELGVPASTPYDHLYNWPDSPRTKAFIARRGHGEPLVDGSHNWISSRATGIPDTFKHTLRGLDPLFRDLANLDFRPRKGSPLISAGLAPLPQGRVTDLTPLFEPSRSIPLDLMLTPRRQVSPPSIGPFEPAP